MSLVTSPGEASPGQTGNPFVSIVMPALNEENWIAAAIASIQPKTTDLDYEINVVDGGSTDATREIVLGLAASNPRIHLLANAKRIQAAAVNLAARVADPRARCIVRADCHAAYPPGFISRCVATLAATNAASVVVSMETRGVTCLQKAIAAAQNSRLGNGGAAHRGAGHSGFVDHGHHAAFDRTAFLALGGYDETFSHNEDAEFDLRMTAQGRPIYLDADNSITYYPRSSLSSLARQYFAFGRGRARTVLKHRTRPRLRQLLPLAALSGCAVGLAVAPLLPLALALPAAYALACIGYGLVLAVCARSPCLAFSGVAAIVMHQAWACGFVAGIASASQPNMVRSA
jgi:succinoglycan biosynthesis protein ExoA